MIYIMEMFGISLVLTILIELPVALLFGMRSRKEVLLVLLVNVLTNPPAVLSCWILGMLFPALPRILLQVPVEFAVVAAEALVYCSFAKDTQWKITHPVILSFLANACSWLFGLMLTILCAV